MTKNKELLLGYILVLFTAGAFLLTVEAWDTPLWVQLLTTIPTGLTGILLCCRSAAKED